MTKKNNKIAYIDGIVNGNRISTHDLLQEIYKKLDEGYNEFEINALGQHNIGGPIWSKNGEPLKFKVTNPGQRVGSMGMQGTQIVIEGPAPADVGWLNAGAEITLKGDGGDTTSHCAATGKIYVGGRVGTRSGALMKYDPRYTAPEFWVLKNTGSFSFEFMGGGIAVICGYDCENIDSVLGYRSCVGMVGGTVYVRGSIKDLSSDVWLLDLDDSDKDFLKQGIPTFLEKINKTDILDKFLQELGQTKNIWKKIVAKTYEERKVKKFTPLKDFRKNEWIEGGIFGELIKEDYKVLELVEKDNYRLRIPEWHNAAFSAPCEYNCPIGIPTQKRISLLREGQTEEALNLVLEYSPFPASVCGQVCPNLCLDDCNRKFLDIPVKIKELGLLSESIKINKPEKELNQRIAIIGSGVSGLSAAFHLRKMGYQVDVFEKDTIIGGKLKQVIPEDRLNQEILEHEINRIQELGVNYKPNSDIDKTIFEKLQKEYDATIISSGAHNPVIIPFEGHEKLVKGLEFLKEINKGKTPKIGKKVVVIGAGNAAMDVVLGAYKCGAEKVTAIDIQEPAAFEKEIEHAKKLGAEILWPCFTQKITDEGVVLKDGRLLEADTVIISVGDRPDLSFVPSNYLDENNRIQINEYLQVINSPKVFVAGDVIKQGLFTNAIADGRKIALNIDKKFKGEELDSFEKAPMIPQDRIKKEYYEKLKNEQIDQISAEDETQRCLSCGYCRDCELCKEACPEQAISRISHPDGKFEYVSDPKRCIGCGICAGICPCGIWTMENNLLNFK